MRGGFPDGSKLSSRPTSGNFRQSSCSALGKTTLAHELARARPSTYLDLERPADRAKLTDAELFLSAHERERSRTSLLPSAGSSTADGGVGFEPGAMDLLRQSGESLAGRVAFVELRPFDALEVPSDALDRLWVRGGLPESFLAWDDGASLRWRDSFVQTYLERDIPQLGPRIPAETLRRFWTMLAHSQGSLLNAAALARGLAVGRPLLARADLEPARSFVVTSGSERYPLGNGVDAIGLRELGALVAASGRAA